MAGRLEGKAAVITGAGSGMGRAMVDRFCREGARVLAVDVSGKQEELAAQIGPACVPFHRMTFVACSTSSLSRFAFGLTVRISSFVQ